MYNEMEDKREADPENYPSEEWAQDVNEDYVPGASIKTKGEAAT